VGYTVTFKPITKTVSNYLLEFMRNIHVGSKFPENVYPILRRSSSLSYCNKRGHIGFDYGPGSDRELVYTLIHWMVNLLGSEKFYYYDGEKTELSEERNQLGVRDFNDAETDFYGYNREVFEDEIRRVERLWYYFLSKKSRKDSNETLK
jgi:hypothetical protein